MDVDTYYPGQEIRAEFDVRSRARTTPKSVTAVFAHNQDRTATIQLTGRFGGGGDVGADSPVLVSARVTPENMPGFYRCVSMEVDYGNGVMVPFDQPPDAAFRIGAEDIPAPELVSPWRWVKD